MSQTVKNLLAMQKTWVQFLGWEDPLEKGKAPTPVFWPGEFHGWRSLAGYSPWGCKELDMTEWLSHTHTHTTHFIYNVVLISSVQKSDPVIHTYIYIYILFFNILSIMVYHRMLNIVLCAIQWDLVVWSILYIIAHMEPMKQKLTPGHTEQTFGCQGEEDWGGMVQEVGINKCKLLYIEWINKMNVYIF